MTQLSSNAPVSKPNSANNEIADTGKIRIGGGFRLPPSEIKDPGRIRLGGGFRLPAAS